MDTISLGILIIYFLNFFLSRVLLLFSQGFLLFVFPLFDLCVTPSGFPEMSIDPFLSLFFLRFFFEVEHF